MEKEHIFLILTFVFIVILLLVSEFQKPIIQGEVEKISDQTPVRIYIKNQTVEIIAFSKIQNIKPNSQIEIYGTKQNEIIIAQKIKCLNC